MFSRTPCPIKDCGRHVAHGQHTCYLHCPDKKEVLDMVCSIMTVRELQHDIVLTDARFEHKDFSKAALATCRFSRCTFHDVDF
ncbi:MAG: hypothetical protein PHR01_01395 [Sphaerochaetaceae bacterium]|nr:hypothetical protein [Sphaerochaetaceae bacterium]